MMELFLYFLTNEQHLVITTRKLWIEGFEYTGSQNQHKLVRPSQHGVKVKTTSGVIISIFLASVPITREPLVLCKTHSHTIILRTS